MFPAYTTEGSGKCLTSEFQPPKLEGDQTVAYLYEVHQGVEIVGGQDEAVSCAVVAPPSQKQVSTETVL